MYYDVTCLQIGFQNLKTNRANSSTFYGAKMNAMKSKSFIS